MKARTMLLMLFFIGKAYAWQWLAPLPHGNHCNDIHVFNAQSVLAAGDLGTIMKSDDGGVQWDVQQRVEGFETPVNSLCFIDANTGWAAGGDWYEGFVLQTTDGGNTWTTVFTQGDAFLDVKFIDQNTGWAITDDWETCVYHTIDGGQAWTKQALSGDMDLEDLFMIDGNAGWVVGGGWGDKAVFYTNNGGAEWHRHALALEETMNCIFFLDNQTGWLAGDDGHVYQTLNGGTDWTLIATVDIYDFTDIYFADAQTGWGSSGYGIIYHTTDGGKSWARYAHQCSSDLKALAFYNASDGWAVGRGGTVLKTVNGGDEWQQCAGGSKNWNQTVCFLDANTGFLGGNESWHIIKSNDGGLTWQEVWQKDWWSSEEFFFVNDLLGFCAGSQFLLAGILRTEDGGNTWEACDIDESGSCEDIFFIDENQGWAVGQDGVILKTTDGGHEWATPADDPLDVDWNTVWFHDCDFGLIAGTAWTDTGLKSAMYETRDGGQTWTEKMGFGEKSLNDFHFINAEQGWAVGAQALILKTSDGGETWDPLTANLTSNWEEINAVHFVNEHIGFIATDDANVYQSEDGGMSWNRQNTGTANPLTDICFVDENTGWTCGWYDTLLKTKSGGVISAVENAAVLPDQSMLIPNYPNPFNPETTLCFMLARRDNVELAVYNLKGQRVALLMDGDQDAGMHQVHWYAGGLPSGVYVCKLTTAQAVYTSKLILQK